MAISTRDTALPGHYHHIFEARPDFSMLAFSFRVSTYSILFGKRWLSSSTDSSPSEFAGLNAYELLGVSETSSFAEIKASFRKLAKETHPDLAESSNDHSASKRFIQILAAYEILSDSEKRVHYDGYLLSQRTTIGHQSRHGYEIYKYWPHTNVKQMEVVEWLRWYRYAINEILSKRRLATGSGYFDILERDFYSAIHSAFYGPKIDKIDLLPHCFEAEERSLYATPEVLHLVSGRDLFGIVRVTNNCFQIPDTFHPTLPSSASSSCHSAHSKRTLVNSQGTDCGTMEEHEEKTDFPVSDVYGDLELHLCGRCVAIARRVPPQSHLDGIDNDYSQDRICIYLTSAEARESPNMDFVFPKDTFRNFYPGIPKIPLGTITGLATSPEEGPCYVYNSNGIKTHVIMKHRTLLVKHMHWYQLGDEVAICECRCSRARLPPSKYWLFEPRSGMHDVGGWYVETFGKDKKGRTVPSPRHWDGLYMTEQFGKRLHPAMYLLALAYRTLDIEDAKRRKINIKDIVEAKILRMLGWCKKLF